MPQSAGKELFSSSSQHSMPAFGPRALPAGLHSHVVAHISTSSPPASPANSPRLRSGRTVMPRGGGGGGGGGGVGGGGGGGGISSKSKHGSPGSGKASLLRHHRPPLLQKLSQLFLSFFFRRHRLLLVIPFVYITGTLWCMGGDIALPNEKVRLPVYRSDLVFEHLWPDMEQAEAESDSVESRALNDPFDGSHGRQVLSIWEYPKEGGGFTPCINNINHDPDLPESNGYIIVEANGGLNQQRSTICNAVAVAKLLNATLIIPHFHLNAVWKDPSTFGDIFDEPYFIKSLSQQVRILHELPEEVMKVYGNMSMIYKIPKVQAWSLPRFYLEKALPELLQRGAIRFTPFANRLAYDGVPKRLQKLRCYANFVALRFAQPIANIGNELVKRMKAKSAKSNGNYVSIHLRFEEDMVAFSQCVYDGSKEETSRLDNFREHSWRGKFTRIGRVNSSPGEIRRNGKCPLTPVEVGMMLRGMGFRKTTPIFLAAGTIFKEEESMEPLRRMFPYLQTKETLMTPDEFDRFKGFSSRLAAIDYTVCLHSEVFVTTQGGNFPQILMGHRRFLNKGHSKTINPDKRRLVLLLNNPHIEWEVFRKSVVDMRRNSDFKGLQPRKSLPVQKTALFTNPPKASLYTFPAPECMCAETHDDTTDVLVSRE